MSALYHRILVPIDLADAELAKPAIASAVMMAKESNAVVRLINVLPITPAVPQKVVTACEEITTLRMTWLPVSAT